MTEEGAKAKPFYNVMSNSGYSQNQIFDLESTGDTAQNLHFVWVQKVQNGP